LLSAKHPPLPDQEEAGSNASECRQWIIYTARIDVSGGKSLNMSLYFGDEKICEAYSKIKGPGKLDLMQAISYAAHMMYKIAEQEELKKRK